MDFYDIVYPFSMPDGFPESLGYRRIFAIGKDVKASDGLKGLENGIFIAKENSNVMAAIGLRPRAIVFEDMRINKKALEMMEDRGIALCIPLSSITSLYGLRRSRALYMTAKLLRHSAKIGIDVSIASFARSREYMCSPIQIIAIAKALGIDEEYARRCISETNRKVAMG